MDKRTDTVDVESAALRIGKVDEFALRVVGERLFAVHALPADGTVVIGRSTAVEVMIDEPSISRRHAMLHLGAKVMIEDLGSVNGTRVGGRRLVPGETIEVARGQVVELGSVMVIVQPRSVSSRPRRVWDHGYLEGRLEEECARAERTGASFALARIKLPSAAAREAVELVGRALRPTDTLATYGPDEWEILLADIAPDDARSLLDAIRAELLPKAGEVEYGMACCPRDGRTPEDLVARAGDALHGEAAKPVGALVLRDVAMEDLYRVIDRVAAGQISVLLLGETGVGKEVVGGEIHRRSPRADKPYVKLNCAALSESLLESELFGHEKGAFTGAVATKPGLLETAEGGTVFLDEVGELPPSTQVKLLRVLEERRVLRVGGLKPRAIDVRFVSATNRNLEAEIARGTFRQDLFFRLNGISLVIPPLRERVAEVEPLARAFVTGAAKLAGRRAEPKLAPETIDLLRTYSWPGNIRELRNVIERAVLLCSGPTLLPQHLPLEKFLTGLPDRPAVPQVAAEPRPLSIPPPPSLAAAPPAAPRTPAFLRGEIAALERSRIVEALERFAGNQSRAARALGISRATLVKRIEQWGLPRPRK